MKWKKKRFHSEIFLEWKWNVDSDTIRYKNEQTVSFRIFVSRHVCISHDLKSFFCINLTNALCEEAFAPIFWSFLTCEWKIYLFSEMPLTCVVGKQKRNRRSQGWHESAVHLSSESTFNGNCMKKYGIHSNAVNQ